MEITVSQILSFLTIAAGAIGSIGAIYAAFNKIFTKKINEEMTDAIKPVNQALEEIKEQNNELKQQGKETREEIILVMKLNQAMISELQTLGHVNGETTQALQDLNNYLINK